jgi:hypothetical protein
MKLTFSMGSLISSCAPGNLPEQAKLAAIGDGDGDGLLRKNRSAGPKMSGAECEKNCDTQRCIADRICMSERWRRRDHSPAVFADGSAK